MFTMRIASNLEGKRLPRLAHLSHQIVHGIWLHFHFIFFVGWNSFLPSKHKEVKFFYVTNSFLRLLHEELQNVFWLSIKSFIFLHHALFMSNGLWGIQIKTSLDCFIRVFCGEGWCALHERTFLARVRKLTRETDVFFQICHVSYVNILRKN